MGPFNPAQGGPLGMPGLGMGMPAGGGGGAGAFNPLYYSGAFGGAPHVGEALAMGAEFEEDGGRKRVRT